MSDQPEKRKPGRQPGWRKKGKLEAKLPAIRVSDELLSWLEEEMDANSLATLSDVIRIKLSEAMRSSRGGNEK